MIATSFSIAFRIPFHEFLLKKIDEKPGDRVWLKDVSMGRVETFGGVKKTVMRVASGILIKASIFLLIYRVL